MAASWRLHISGWPKFQFILRDPDQPNIKILGQQRPQFLQEQGIVPTAQFGQLVVGNPIRPALGFGQMPEHDHRNFGQPKMRRRQDTTVASDQLPIGPDQHRYRPAELGHAGGDLGHLVGVMGLGIAGVRLQLG